MENKVGKEQMKQLPYIIAVDFDGTLVEDKFPEIGAPRPWVWADLRKARDNGAKIILWTSRDHENLTQAIEYCKSLGLEFDAVNENLPECQKMFNNDTRKVFADEYWDDKAVAMYTQRKFSKYDCECGA